MALRASVCKATDLDQSNDLARSAQAGAREFIFFIASDNPALAAICTDKLGNSSLGFKAPPSLLIRAISLPIGSKSVFASFSMLSCPEEFCRAFRVMCKVI
ncbi:protein of unknown function [Cyanobium sp. NIES-981]|nr:protein of unknown function [Cyanobium sp. NIES-981]